MSVHGNLGYEIFYFYFLLILTTEKPKFNFHLCNYKHMLTTFGVAVAILVLGTPLCAPFTYLSLENCNQYFVTIITQLYNNME